jgi:hypothetical protein
MGKFEKVMSKMELKKTPKDVWRLSWASVYNRLERRIGWILLSIGAMITLFFGGYKIVEESREQAIDRMIGEAEELGANAIITVRFTTSMIMQSASEILD